MRDSTISKHRRWGARTRFARVLGAELRRQRTAARRTQREVAGTLSVGFVSAVERGHVVPSLPALALILDSLGVELADFFVGVKWELGRYSDPREARRRSPQAPRRQGGR